MNKENKMICPLCGVETTDSMMAHILYESDEEHIKALLPIVSYVRRHARKCFAFEIATNFANDAVANATELREFKNDMASLTSFISRCIPELGFNRRRCISFDRQSVPTMTKTPLSKLQDDALLSKLLELCSKSVLASVPTHTHPVIVTKNNKNQNVVEITKIFRFAAAHHLPGHARLCQYSHGHEWKLEVTVRGFVDPVTNMVLDFSDLKAIVKNVIIDVLDHNYINDIIWNPTAENLCAWILAELNANGLTNVSKIKLWEAEDSFAVLEKFVL